MARVSLNVEIPDLARKIEKAGEIALDVRAPLKAVADYLGKRQDTRFAAGDFPPPLKSSTVERKRRAGVATPELALTATGALRRNMIHTVEMSFAVLRPGPGEAWYAHILQVGGGAVPARPLFTLDEDEAAQVYAEAMEGPVKEADAFLR